MTFQVAGERHDDAGCAICANARSTSRSRVGLTGAVADDLAAEVLLKAPLAVLADRRHPLAPAQKRLSLADTMERGVDACPRLTPFSAASSVDVFQSSQAAAACRQS